MGLVGGGSSGGIVHYDGTAWKDVDLGDASTVNDLHAVWGSSQTDVWAVGTSTILHFDGSTWSPAPGTPASGFLSGLWGTGQTDVWAVGGATILHFDGTAWSMSSTGIDAGAYSLNRVWGSGAADVWAVGSIVTGLEGPAGPGAILHWTGAGWTACTIATTALTGVWGAGARTCGLSVASIRSCTRPDAGRDHEFLPHTGTRLLLLCARVFLHNAPSRPRKARRVSSRERASTCVVTRLGSSGAMVSSSLLLRPLPKGAKAGINSPILPATSPRV